MSGVQTIQATYLPLPQFMTPGEKNVNVDIRQHPFNLRENELDIE